MANSKELKAKIEEFISSTIQEMGYELVAVEFHQAPEKRLSVFIDHSPARPTTGVGIDDCVTVTKALDQPLDENADLENFFGSQYSLEVSSPGIERPLRKIQDFDRFQGKLARVHTFRPLEAQEIENENYLGKNPKQKNFSGYLQGTDQKKILMNVGDQLDCPVRIPHALITKAHLEFDPKQGRKEIR